MIQNSKQDYYIAIIEQCVSDSSKFCWNRGIAIKNTSNDSSCNCNSNCESYQAEYWFIRVSNPVEDVQSLPYFQKWKV